MCSSDTREVIAMVQALEWIEEWKYIDDVIIEIDSRSLHDVLKRNSWKDQK